MKHALCALTAVAAALSFSTTASAAKYYNCVNTSTSASCTVNGDVGVSSTYGQTVYPIVLAHGLIGFTKVGSLDYFYGVPQDLTTQGSLVYSTLTSAVDSSSGVRGEQLLRQVNTILALSGKSKVNLIGHSQGGLDSRYVAGVAPTKIASVTTVATPHKGSPVADLTLKILKGEPTGLLQSAANGLASGIGQLITGVSGGSGSQSLSGSLSTLSTAGAATFNQRFPAGVPTTSCGSGATSSQGIKFYSWGGTQALTNVLDVTDASFALTMLAFWGGENDGVVGRCSNRFGTVIRDNYGMNHGDVINQVFGLVRAFETNPKTLYRQQANRLKGAGL